MLKQYLCRGLSNSQLGSILKFAHTLAILAILIIVSATLTANSTFAQQGELNALGGEWIYMEDLTEGRALEYMGPPMSSKFSLGIEEGAVILVSGHGSGHRNVRIGLDNSVTEVEDEKKTVRYHGSWKNNMFSYEVNFVRESVIDPKSKIQREFQITTEGLVVTVTIGSPTLYKSVGLYRHAEDIPMPTQAIAGILDIAWLQGAWKGSRGKSGSIKIEERWSPPLGGAMLGVSRTVSAEKMSAFEFLRIIENEGGLVYIAQPGGGAPTEFVLTKLDSTNAVFENPRHDYPKRISYELTKDGGLKATIGFTIGGSPRSFEYKRE